LFANAEVAGTGSKAKDAFCEIAEACQKITYSKANKIVLDVGGK
jgi:hypothetical protein